MSGVIKWILISIVTIGLTAGIAFFILVRPSLDDLHLEGLQKFITYLQSLSFTPAIGPEPGHIILFAKSTADFLSAVSLKGVDISINHVELEKQDGSWIAAATSSKNIQLLQHTDKDIGIPLSDIIIPADTYIGIRFSFGTTTVLTTASTTLTASMPSQVFEIPIHATVPSNGVSTVTLSVLPKESIFKNKNTYTFAPFAVLESRTDAQVFTSSDLKIVAAFNTGTLQELVQAQMYGNGQTQGVHLALAAERPPVIKKSSSTYSTGSGQNSSHTTGNTQNNLIYSIGTPTRPVSPPQQSVIPTAQPLPQPSNPLSNTSQPPVFDYQSSQNVHVGQLLTLIVHATSPTGQALTYGIGDIPGDADFDPDAQLFTWIPDTAGTYPAVFTATDGVNTISQTIIIVVTDPHAVNNPLQPPVTPPVTPPTQPLPPVQPPTNNPPGAIGTTFNVKNYGAKGDGTTDDINSINKAIADLVAAKGGTLYFPQGIYRISSTVEIDYLSNFKVIGTSATLKQVDGPYTNYYTISNMYLRSDSNFTIQGLTFDGDSQNRVRGEFAGNTLMIRGDSNFTITGNNFINSICDDIIMYADKPGDDSTAVHEGIVSNNTFTGAYRNALSIIHGHNITVTNNTIQNVNGTDPASGIDIEANINSDPNQGDSDGANHDITISNNTFRNNQQSCIAIPRVLHPTNITIDSNTFDNCPQEIYSEAVALTVTNNIFQNDTPPTSGLGSGSAAVIFAGREQNATLMVTGNTFKNNGNIPSIYVFQGWTGQVTISNNTVSNSQGMSVSTDNAIITGNTLSNMNAIGIAVVGNHLDIEHNNLSNITSIGIYAEGGSNTISNNTLTDVGLPDRGLIIQTIYSHGGNTISNNKITKTVPNLTWKVIDGAPSDTITNNTIIGLLGDPLLVASSAPSS